MKNRCLPYNVAYPQAASESVVSSLCFLVDRLFQSWDGKRWRNEEAWRGS